MEWSGSLLMDFTNRIPIVGSLRSRVKTRVRPMLPASSEHVESRGPVVSELERRTAHEAIACYGRAPMPLDVRDHLLVAPEMPAWIPMI